MKEFGVGAVLLLWWILLRYAYHSLLGQMFGCCTLALSTGVTMVLCCDVSEWQSISGPFLFRIYTM